MAKGRRRYIPLSRADKLQQLLADAQDQRQSWIRQLEESKAGADSARKVRLRGRIAMIEGDIRELRQEILEAQQGVGNNNAN